MNNAKKFAILVAISQSLVGCVNLPPSISDIKPVSTSKSFTLADNLVGKQKFVPLESYKSEYALAKGTYTAESENDKGTLFKGPKFSVMVEMAHACYVWSGGLWVPKNPQEKLRLYRYLYVDEIAYKTCDAALSVLGKTASSGSPGISATAAELSNQTSATNLPVVTNSTVGTSPIQAGIGGGIGAGIVGAFIASDIKNNAGKPGLMWEIDNADLEALTRRQAN
ncbi:hypothetical protein [Collimonas pratensis]|uniref:hypothetical protein n=1 Tax=Collimonas pratensis TaxID=279113 RepID=UPI000A84ECE6|nr:hypothetical protein [Collimonas pratensis]